MHRQSDSDCELLFGSSHSWSALLHRSSSHVAQAATHSSSVQFATPPVADPVIGSLHVHCQSFGWVGSGSKQSWSASMHVFSWRSHSSVSHTGTAEITANLFDGGGHVHVQSERDVDVGFGSRHVWFFCVHVPFEHVAHVSTHSSSGQSARDVSAEFVDGGGHVHVQSDSDFALWSGSLQVCVPFGHRSCSQVGHVSTHSSIMQSATLAVFFPVVGGGHTHSQSFGTFGFGSLQAWSASTHVLLWTSHSSMSHVGTAAISCDLLEGGGQ
ncbi:hypothetical protein DIPPA_07901 [Diplonema papillatum]|nr:hypothetical protein DIPPA_07901 [Diplonema papillatum]